MVGEVAKILNEINNSLQKINRTLVLIREGLSGGQKPGAKPGQ